MALTVVLQEKNATPATPQDPQSPGFLSTLTSKVLNFMTGNKYADFTNAFKPVAAQIERETGIKPIIAIAQAAHESNWGLSELSRSANSLFGFTAQKSWVDAKKPTVWRNTDEHSDKPPEQIQYWEYPGDVVSKRPDGTGGSWLTVKRPFRAYASWLESAQDWARLISTSSRYAQAYAAAKNGDLNNFAQEVKNGGYATDPDYPGLIVNAGLKAEAVMV